MECETELSEKDKIEKFCSQFPDIGERNPDLLYFLAIIFLRFRRFNLEEASSRFMNYVTWRNDVLGGFSENADDEIHRRTRQQLETGFLHILPQRLPNGAAIAYLELRRHDTSSYSATDTIRAWHSAVIGALIKNPDLAESGFVIINNMMEVGLWNLDTAIPKAIASAVANCMPVRLVHAFIINPPWVARFIIPLIKLLLSEKLGQRLNLITDVTELQSKFDLPASHLPIELGGVIHLNDLPRHAK